MVSGSHRTRPWREVDSNSESRPVRNGPPPSPDHRCSNQSRVKRPTMRPASSRHCASAIFSPLRSFFIPASPTVTRILRGPQVRRLCRFPVRIKHKDGARRRRSAYPAHGRQQDALVERGDSNSAPALKSMRSLNCFGTSGFDRAANRPCRSCSSGFGAEVRGFLESYTRIAAKVRNGSTDWCDHRPIKPLRRASILRAWPSQHGSGTGRHRQTFRWCRPG